MISKNTLEKILKKNVDEIIRGYGRQNTEASICRRNRAVLCDFVATKIDRIYEDIIDSEDEKSIGG